jgi:hypothetical protein
LWSNQSVQEKSILPAAIVPAVLTFQDAPRVIRALYPSPPCVITNKPSFVALSDHLGRVLVYDMKEGSFIRLFKGARNAQCGWIQYLKQNNEKSHRIHLFLVIYSERGVLEVYQMKHGNRVGAFEVGAGLQLVQTQGTVLGHVYAAPKCLFLTQCYLIHPFTGTIQNVCLTLDES